MEQQTSSLVAVMLLRHARRALLLLGGVLVWWLVFLAGGAAHADGTGVTEPVTTQSAGAVRLVDQTARTLADSVRTVPHVTQRAAAASGQAPAPVASTVRTLTAQIEPGLSSTTTEAADVLDDAVTQTESALVPVLAPTVRQHTSSPTETTRQTHRHVPTSAHQAQEPAAAVVSDHASSATPSGAGSRVGTADNGSLPTAPGAPRGPVLPGGSSAGGGAGTASLAAMFVMVPAVRRSRRARDAAGLPSAPAFAPGSSPD